MTTVLIADGSLTIRMDLCTVFDEAGFTPEACADAACLEQRLQRGLPDAIVLSSDLPGLDVNRLLHWLQEPGQRPRVPMVVLLAHPADETLCLAASTCYGKPYDAAQVVAKVRSLLEPSGMAAPQPPPRILLVDDSLTFREVAGEALRDQGFDVRTAPSGEAALAELARTPVDGVLLDLNMPGLSGLETCRRIKRSPKLRMIPVVFLTAAEDRQTMLEGLRAGADDYVAKSSDFDVITGRLQAHIRRRLIEEENQHLRDAILHKEMEATEARAARALAEARARYLEDLEQQHAELCRQRDALLRAQRRMAILAEASRMLVTPLESRTAFADLVAWLVRDVVDYGVIAVRGEDDACELQASAHSGPEASELLRRLISTWCHSTTDNPIGRVLASGRTEFLPEVTPADWERLFPADQREGIRRLHPTSLITVPLQAHDVIWGVAHLAMVRDHFGDEDRLLFEELGRRAGLVIDNARLYQQTQQAVKVRDDFLSIASHELKTPITSLQLHIESLLRKLQRQSRQVPGWVIDKLKIAERQVGRLTMLINELLDVSRISTGQLAFELEPVDMVAIVQEVVQRFHEEARRAGSPLRVRGDSVLVGEWDRLRLDQIVTNLVANAIKYGNGKPVAVTVARQDGQAVLTVKDQGIGIAAKDQARIFERFERLMSVRNYGGFGLGLWIVRQIIEALGGTITVSSAPGQGSTFTVTLPLARHERLAA